MQADPLLFTAAQVARAQAAVRALRDATRWHGQLPVLLLNRCWLRLTVVPVERLALELPPDLSRDAPELRQFRALLEAGHPPWQAQQLCWQEFGAEACHQALRNFWRSQDHPSHGWTLERYLELLADYRHRFAGPSPRELPLLVLARASVDEHHGLLWLRPDLSIAERAMRHTCA